MHRVVVTGIGAVSPLGISLSEIWPKLIGGQSAVRLMPDSYDNLPCRIASPIDDRDIESIKRDHLSPSERKSMSRSSMLLMKAVKEALASAGLSDRDIERGDLDKYGVSVGIGFDSVDDSLDTSKFNATGNWDRPPYSAVGPYALTRALGNMPAAHISVRYKFRGMSRSTNTACAAGLHAIGDAFRAVQSGEAKLMIAGGVDASISPWSVAAFSRIRALPTKFNDRPNSASRPFDINRSGFVMAEGAGAVVLESLEHFTSSGSMRSPPLAEIIGFGQSGDGFSLVAAGDGAYRSMRSAIESAGIGPEQVTYVNAHATSTPQGDIIECQAIERLFGRKPVVSSFKGQLGHCLGGSGAIETVLTVRSITEGHIPPNCNLEHPDPEIHVSLVPGDTSKLFVWDDEWKIVVKNSFGFGGTNGSIVLKKFVNV